MNNITTISLPSNGYLEDIPAQITIREMTGSELSAIYSNFNDAAIDYVLEQTIIKPEGLDIEKLTEQDKAYILHSLRQLTYGNSVPQTLRCQFCGTVHEYDINYSDFKTKPLDGEYVTNNTFEVEGHTYTRKIPTVEDIKLIPNFIERFNVSVFDHFLVQQIQYIENIDNNLKTNIQKLTHLKNIPGRSLSKVIDKLKVDFGLDTTYHVDCKNCSMAITGGLGLSPNLFR